MNIFIVLAVLILLGTSAYASIETWQTVSRIEEKLRKISKSILTVQTAVSSVELVKGSIEHALELASSKTTAKAKVSTESSKKANKGKAKTNGKSN